MGSAIAAGIHNSGLVQSLTVVNRSEKRLAPLKEMGIDCGTSLREALANDLQEVDSGKTLVILALRIEVIPQTIETICSIAGKNIIIASLSPLTSLDYLKEKTAALACPVMRIMPNIAITCGESMTFICSDAPESVSTGDVLALFNTMGSAAVIPESLFPAGTALASCGIAYALRYIRACMQAGVQMGLEPGEACSFTLQTLRGAAALLEAGGMHPEQAIDDVMTPGGLTVRGVNALDKNGFTAAVLAAFEASYKPADK